MKAAQRAKHCTCECHHRGTPSDCGDKQPAPSPCRDVCDKCGGGQHTPHCPPPPYPCHDGTVSFPPHDAPPTVTVDPDPNAGRPPKGDPGENGWFGTKVKGFNGRPSFGPRKNEHLPYLVMS